MEVAAVTWKTANHLHLAAVISLKSPPTACHQLATLPLATQQCHSVEGSPRKPERGHTTIVCFVCACYCIFCQPWPVCLCLGYCVCRVTLFPVCCYVFGFCCPCHCVVSLTSGNYLAPKWPAVCVCHVRRYTQPAHSITSRVFQRSVTLSRFALGNVTFACGVRRARERSFEEGG